MSESKKVNKNLSRLIIFLAIVSAVLYFLVTNLEKLGSILIVLLGFGAVVLVHEFGHFIVAKLSGVKVEAFSIGFSPILFGVKNTEGGLRVRILPDIFKKSDEDEEGLLCFRIGQGGKQWETEYRVGMIPFGGFVKMLGQDDVGPAKESDDPRSYANKPVGPRLAIVGAGVTFNALSAILIFMITFMVGINMPPAVVGSVEPDSPAAVAGLEPGDQILSIDGDDAYLDFTNLSVAAALSGKGEEVSMKVRHATGQVEELKVAAKKMYGSELRMFGVQPAMSLEVGEVTDVEALKEQTGLMPGDVIKEVNREEVEHHWELADVLRDSNEPAASILAERRVDGEVELVATQIPLNLSINEMDADSAEELSSIYTMVPRLQVSFAGEDIELESGDIILSAGDVNYPTYVDLRAVTESYAGRKLEVGVLRYEGGEPVRKTVTVEPRQQAGSERVVIGIGVALDGQHAVVAETVDIPGGAEALDIPKGAEIVGIGGEEVGNFYDVMSVLRKNEGETVEIVYDLDGRRESVSAVLSDVSENITTESTLAEYVPFKPLEKLYKAKNPAEALVMGFDKTKMFIFQSYLTLKRMIGGLISPDMLVGPVGIVKISYNIVSSRPFVYYIYFLGLINASIAVINLLPMLPFDGGIIVLLVVEKLKGSAVSEKVQGYLSYLGVLVIGVFFVYVTFNDIIKIIRDSF